MNRLLLGEHMLWLLGSLCTLHRIPFDAALVAQQFPPPHTVASFHAAARALVVASIRPEADVSIFSIPNGLTLKPFKRFRQPGTFNSNGAETGAPRADTCQF